MLPMMIPLVRRLTAEELHRFAVFTRLPDCAAVAALDGIAPGAGQATALGAPLRWESVPFRGISLLFVCLRDADLRPGQRCRVTLQGFVSPGGRHYPKFSFTARLAPLRMQDPAAQSQDAAALEIAREGMVLLRNDNAALPLAPDATLNCLGAAQHQWRTSMGGAAKINPRWQPDFMQAVEGHSAFTVNPALSDAFRHGRDEIPPEALLAEAAANGGPALVFIGRHAAEMLDSRDIPGEYRLTEAELALLRAARQRFERLVVILNTAGPLDMTWLKEIDADAVLFTGFGGMLSAWALVEILDGRANPSGHLPDTWPWRWADNPVSRNFPTLPPDSPHVHEDETGVRVYYGEDVYLGYRYFDTFAVPVAFPFGHGLSYTTFALQPRGPEGWPAETRLRVTVRNTGAVAGKAVVQLYVAPPAGRLERPAHLLAGFDKTALLMPGCAQTLDFQVDWRDVAAYDESRGAWVLEAGDYAFFAGESLGKLIPAGSLRLGETVLRRTQRLLQPVEDFKRLTRKDPTVDGSKSRIVPLGQQIAVPAPRLDPRPGEGLVLKLKQRRRRPKPVLWREVLADPGRLDAFVRQLSLVELVRLNVCAGSRWMPWQDGMAGSTPAMPRYGLPAFNVADANSGLNLKAPNVGLPASSVVAATFNREMAALAGRAVAAECPAQGVSLVLAPGMNLHRSPLCGRHGEYFSEDPYLAGQLAGQHARALEQGGVGACYKHLFCNNAELGRLGSHSVVSEQALRELYLRSFEIAFRVHRPRSVMTSYNALNGLYPGENPAMIHGLLRAEWGFGGFVMSDWSSTRTVSAEEMVRAGNCWITPGGLRWVAAILRAAHSGRIPRWMLEENVRWLLRGFAALDSPAAKPDALR